MEITLDKFGRVVIPKSVRERLGVGPGSTFEVDANPEDGILLRPRRPEPDLVEEQGVLVFTGEAVGDLETAVERQRSARLEDLGGWS